MDEMQRRIERDGRMFHAMKEENGKRAWTASFPFWRGAKNPDIKIKG